MRKATEQFEPPTIAALKKMGLTGIDVVCIREGCRHSGSIEWDRLKLPDDTQFPTIISKSRFQCQKCGNRSVQVVPDWSGYRASGMEKKFND